MKALIGAADKILDLGAAQFVSVDKGCSDRFDLRPDNVVVEQPPDGTDAAEQRLRKQIIAVLGGQRAHDVGDVPPRKAFVSPQAPQGSADLADVRDQSATQNSLLRHLARHGDHAAGTRCELRETNILPKKSRATRRINANMTDSQTEVSSNNRMRVARAAQ